MATTSTTPSTVTPHQRQSNGLKPVAARSSLLSVFDLTKVGLGGTLSVGVFLVIGYVAKSIAGPSVILSVIVAAIIAFLAGTFYAELNCTIVMSLWRSVQLKTPTPSIASTATIPSISVAIVQPNNADGVDASSACQNPPAALSSKLLIPSFIFTYLCMGEFAAFVVGWNLLLEQVIGVALVAKGIAAYVDMLVFDSAGVNMTQVQPVSSNISDYFDFFPFFIPILIGGPLVLILRRSTVLSTLSAICSIAVVIFILILGMINADVENWTASPPANSTGHFGSGGFFPFGVNGMFQGASVILFTFIGFDSMAYYPLNWYTSKAHRIVEFQKTVTTSILSINGILFISLVGAAVALTSIWPYYLLKEILPLPNAFANAGWSGTIFIVLIAGIIALFGSLFAFMHAILRTIQAMAFDGPRAFKLFAKFEQNNLLLLLREIQLQQAKQQQQLHQLQTSSAPQRHSDEIDVQPQYHNHRQQQLPILGCLIFALLAGLMAALFALEQLMNLLSIGALLMFYTLTLDIILLRYSPNLKKVFSHPECVAAESGPPHASDTPKRSISLIAILLSVYCILCKVLVVLIKLVEYDVIRLPIEWSVSVLVVFIIVMVSILFVIGLQPKRNSLFELKLSVNPLFPAANIFGCVYLMSELNIVTWIRYIIWMLIGIALYIIILKVNHQRRRSFERNVNNNVFMSDHNHTTTTMTEMEEINGSVETLKPFDEDASELNRRSTTPDVIPKLAGMGRQTIETNECPVAARATMQAQAVNSAYMIEEEAVANSPAIRVGNPLTRKSNESQCNGFDDIEFADDVKMSCIEKREPNGKVYFIETDMTSSQTSTAASLDRESSTDSSGENVIIQEMVDKVLFQANRSDPNIEIVAIDRKISPPRSDHDDVSDDGSHAGEAEIETRAIIHTIIDAEAAVEPPVEPATEPAVTTDKRPFYSFGVYQSPWNRRMERSTPDSIGHSKEFKERLTRLLGQYSDESIKSTPSVERKRSISIPADINVVSLNENARPSLKLLVTEGSSSGIPAAPKFDPFMFNTVGRRMKMQHNQIQAPATAISIENEFVKSFDRMAPSSPIHRTKKSNDLMSLFKHETEENAEAEEASVASIKERLNEIYGRGRPPIAPFAEESVNYESDSRRESEEGIQLRKPMKPYDTVHKQKQLFSDVLKSINPDVRNSLHRTESFALADAQADTHKD